MEEQKELVEELRELDRRLRNLRREACNFLRNNVNSMSSDGYLNRRVLNRVRRRRMGDVPTRKLATALETTINNMENYNYDEA